MLPKKNQKFILAIDLGTGGPKVALVSTDGHLAGFEFEPVEYLLLPDGGVEQKPDAWWKAIKKAAKRLIEQNRALVDHIIAVSATAQWSGTVAVDSNGSALMNAIIWMDSRGVEYVKKMTRGWINFEGYSVMKILSWLRLTGGLPCHSGKDPIAHILYIKKNLPQIYAETYKFLEPKDYINLCLTGKFAASYDSITLHWVTDTRDISNIFYDDRLLKMAEISRAKLPDLKRAIDVLGPLKKDVARELGLNSDIQVIMGTPDLQSAAIGSGAVRDYEGHLYIGTSSWLTCHVPIKKTDIVHKMATLPSAIPQRYFVANEQETAGACLKYLVNNFLHSPQKEKSPPGTDIDYDLINSLAESVPAGSNNIIFTPWLNGERTPVEDHTIRGGFHNLSLHTTQDHLIRAVFEGVAYNSRWLLKYVEKFINREFEALNFIGGGAMSDVWCQIHADVLNRTIRQVKDPIQANVKGAAYLASMALGYMKIEDIAQQVEIKRVYKPNPDNLAIYDKLFREFVNIYKKNRSIYARLNGG